MQSHLLPGLGAKVFPLAIATWQHLQRVAPTLASEVGVLPSARGTWLPVTFLDH